MCHPLPLSFVDVNAEVVAGGIAIRATAPLRPRPAWRWRHDSGAVAALTVYDMCKAVDKDRHPRSAARTQIAARAAITREIYRAEMNSRASAVPPLFIFK